MEGIRKNIKFTFEILKEEYFNLKDITNNFSRLKDSLLCEKPLFIRIVRIGMGLGSPKFAPLLNKSPSTLECIEDKKRNILYEKSKEYMDKLKILIKERDINLNDFELIKNNYKKFYTNKLYSEMRKLQPNEARINGGRIGGSSTFRKYGKKHFKDMAKIGSKKGGLAVSKKYSHEHFQSIGKMTYEKYGGNKLGDWGRKGGLITASKQKLTKQENEIKKILDNFNIKHEVHSRVKGKNRDYIVDFFINLKKEKIIIEATNQTHKSQLGIYNKSLDLKKRAENIKLKKNCKFPCILNKKHCIEGVYKLLEVYDCVLTNGDIGDLKIIINNINNEEFLNKYNLKTLDKIRPSVKFQKAGINSIIKRIEPEEKIVFDYLNKNGMGFEHQAVLRSYTGGVRIVDFIVPSLRNTKTIIEVTKIMNPNIKNIKRLVQRLNERFNLLNDFYLKKSNFVGVVDFNGFYNNFVNMGLKCEGKIIDINDIKRLKVILK